MENYYIVEPNQAIRNAGFEYRSKLDQQLEEIDRKISEYSEKTMLKTFVLSFFPIMGLHRMTNGKILSGILFAITGGGLLIWWFFDMLMIASGKFTDEDDCYINDIEVKALEMEKSSLESKMNVSEEIYESWKQYDELSMQIEYDSICEELGG